MQVTCQHRFQLTSEKQKGQNCIFIGRNKPLMEKNYQKKDFVSIFFVKFLFNSRIFMNFTKNCVIMSGKRPLA